MRRWGRMLLRFVAAAAMAHSVAANAQTQYRQDLQFPFPALTKQSDADTNNPHCAHDMKRRR